MHVTDVDLDAASALAAELGGGAFASALDVRDPEACRAAARETADRAGALEAWVNNAGILATKPSWETGDDERAALMRINAEGLMNGTLAALDLMRPQRRGHVVNVVSLAGLVAAPGETVYAASKHAALAFSIGTLYDLRLEGLKGIHVSALCPDGIWTPMLFERARDPYAAGSWSGVMLQPEQVAEAAEALLDRPRAVRTLPRWRGAALRLFDLTPDVGKRIVVPVMADARRRQRRFAERHGR